MQRESLSPIQRINAQSLYGKLNEGMLEERLGAFHVNLKKNLPYIKKFGGIAPVVDYLKGRNICILGAGPSLSRALGVLKKYQHRQEIALIAVDMALLPLVRHGIVPEYVISCETVPLDYFGGINTAGMRLIAFSCMAAANIRRWRGALSFFNWMVSGPPYDALWEKAGVHLGSIATGNIITTQAIALALGCRPESVFIAGNDLAFDNMYYTKGTVAHRTKLRGINRFSSIESAEEEAMRRNRHYELYRQGKKYYTNHQFLAAKTWLEELLAKSAIRVFDASEPGISGKFVEKIRPEDYFMRFERRPSRRKK